MRLGAALLLSGGLANLLPGPPALRGEARDALDAPRAAPVVYTSPPRVPFPVLPLQVWGLRYDLDLVVVSEHPDWTMHEYARVDLPSGPLWLAKDADRDGRQFITTGVPDPAGWVPEVPVARYPDAVRVDDRSTASRIDLTLAYRNPKGQAVTLTWDGPRPTKPSRPRNGNTMGHSRDAVAALLDLHLFRQGGRVALMIDGVEQRVHRVFGLYAMKVALGQTQAGFAIADFRQSPAEGGFTLTRPGDPAAAWPTHATEAWTERDGWARTDGPVTSLRYHFTAGELDRAEVWQVGATVPALHVAFQPALPDVRRRFAGVAESRFAADVAGQRGNGTGVVRAWWVDDDTVRVELRPEAPRWFADRPMDVTVRYVGDAVRVVAERVPEPADPG